jgi:predicted membrane protein
MGLLLGLGLVILGLAFLLSKLGVLGDFDPWGFWPLILVLAGIIKLLGREDPPGRIWGIMLIGAGVLFQLHYLEVLALRWDMVWPVLLMVFGLFILGTSLYHARRRKRVASSDSVVSAFAVLGGKEDQIDSKEFEGGEILAIMGGCNLDLRDARIKGDEAVLNIKAIMGGVELRVPDDWSIVIRGTPIMGAFEDKTRPRRDDDQAPVQRLVIEGMALMGGVEIRN